MPFVRDTDSADGGNGVASSAHDFVKNKLVPFITSTNLFAAGDQWTLERTDVVAVDEEEIFISPGASAGDAPAMAFHTRADALYMFAGTSYVAGTESYALPGNNRQFPGDSTSEAAPSWDPAVDSGKACAWSNIWPTSAFLAHFLFAPPDARYCYAAVQLESRRWRHLAFGQMDKHGALSASDPGGPFDPFAGGGQFLGGHFWEQAASAIDDPYDQDHATPFNVTDAFAALDRQCATFRVPGLRSDAVDWYFCNTRISTTRSIQRPTGASWDTQNNALINVINGLVTGFSTGPGSDVLFRLHESLISSSRTLSPISFFARGESGGTARWMRAGQMPDVFRVNMIGFSPGQEITVGADTFRVFPVVNSDAINTLEAEEYSGYEGVAIRVRS